MAFMRSPVFSILLKVSLALLAIAIFALIYLDAWLMEQFDKKTYSKPASVYARSLDIYQGMPLARNDLLQELAMGHYQRGPKQHAGFYQVSRQGVGIYTQTLASEARFAKSHKVMLQFENDVVTALWRDGQKVSSLRLPPIEIGRIHPEQSVDRLLVSLPQVPESLVAALLVTEDRDFYEHHGVSPKAIARALYANIKNQGIVQGGSTLTQQLVKNFFLSSEQSLMRKGIEAVMALLLEIHADKDAILEAYINEVFIAQDGAKAIHGFGLASQYLFAKPIERLDLSQTALMVGMLKGPSYYNPLKHPERAKKRRNLVLDLLAEQGIYSKSDVIKAKAKGLGLATAKSQKAQAGAYLDLVRRQLKRDYSDDDLMSEGLQIFTNFDPIWQRRAQQSLQTGIRGLQNRYGKTLDDLEGAIVLSNSGTSEVLAVAGSKAPRFSGFNRALDAKRQVGSLIKPAVYLTALEQNYDWFKTISDEPFRLEYDQTTWRPNNFNKKSHGDVTLLEALSNSYNIATARLALDVGLENVKATCEKLGLAVGQALPSLSLGAIDRSPIQMLQMYGTISNHGFYTELKTIRHVSDSQGQKLQRYPLTVEQRFTAQDMHLLHYGLQNVMHDGTGKNALAKFDKQQLVAGKTGTSDGQRDSWFAGFDANKTAVVWLGKDDNSAMPITASTGALPIWANLMAQNRSRLGKARPPKEIEYLWVDKKNGKLSAQRCEDAVYLPVKKGHKPNERAACTMGPKKILHWFKSWFQ